MVVVVTMTMVDIFDDVVDGSDDDFLFLAMKTCSSMGWVQPRLTVVVSNKAVTEAKTTLCCAVFSLERTKKWNPKRQGCRKFWQIKLFSLVNIPSI